jgi:hypothetical protein
MTMLRPYELKAGSIAYNSTIDVIQKIEQQC